METGLYNAGVIVFRLPGSVPFVSIGGGPYGVAVRSRTPLATALVVSAELLPEILAKWSGEFYPGQDLRIMCICEVHSLIERRVQCNLPN